MRERSLVTAFLVAALAGCSGSPSGTATPAAAAPQAAHVAATGSNVISNPGFETGSLSPWTSCGSTSTVAVSTAQAHSGSYSALLGKTSSPEVNGTARVCQTVTVPSGATLSFYVYEGTDDSIKYVDEEADVLSTSGSQLAQLYSEAATTNGWVQKSFSLASYAGQTVQLAFGVKGNGYGSDYVYEYLDDVSVTSSGATSAPTTSPTTAPTPGTTAAPTPVPSAPATTAAYPCNNNQFTTDQSEFANGSISGDQFVQVCGSVTKVLPEQDTTSGHHGYFYVQLPSGYQIEIVSNLDAMAEASTDQPPSTWPWVAVNQYVFVQGRYYYDSSSSQGIDWTEDDTSSSWEHLGYVAVCTSTGANCQKYW